MGLSPGDLLLVRTRDVQTLFAVGEEALRSPAMGAFQLSDWGEAKAFGLMASRRRPLAAEMGCATLSLARARARARAVYGLKAW